MRALCVLILSCGAALAGPGGGPAVYVIGNLEGISPGSEGILALEDDKAVFRSGKAATAIRYSDLHEAELGTRVMPPVDAPLYKVWRLHKRLGNERVMHQLIKFDFADKDGKDQTMTLELEESAAAETLTEVEIRSGKRARPRRATNADGWWGDSLWKTPRNKNTVDPETLGKAPTK